MFILLYRSPDLQQPQPQLLSKYPSQLQQNIISCRHVIYFLLLLLLLFFVVVFILLFAHIEIFSVSGMYDFLLLSYLGGCSLITTLIFEVLAPPLFMHLLFSKHRPSGPMLSISRNVRLCVRLSVCLSVHFWGTV